MGFWNISNVASSFVVGLWYGGKGGGYSRGVLWSSPPKGERTGTTVRGFGLRRHESYGLDAFSWVTLLRPGWSGAGVR